MNPYIIPGLLDQSIKYQIDMVRGVKPKSMSVLLEKCMQFCIAHSEITYQKTRLNLDPITVKDILGKSRKREHVVPRQIFCYYAARLFTRATLREIGAYIGGRDHSTVLHSKQMVQDMIDTDKDFAKFTLIFSKSIGL